MILRCAACISSGSARAIAFSAAVRSPLLIASSTDRTAPRIWVRRDLLMMVRRAILRVAFLAEVVLAIFQKSFGGDRSLMGSGFFAPAAQPRNRRDVVVLISLTMPFSASKYACKTAPLKELRRRDCARRHCRP